MDIVNTLFISDTEQNYWTHLSDIFKFRFILNIIQKYDTPDIWFNTLGFCYYNGSIDIHTPISPNEKLSALGHIYSTKFYSYVDYDRTGHMQMTDNTQAPAPIISTSFKDKFILDYQSEVFNNKLNSYSSSTSKNISKSTYDSLVAIADTRLFLEITNDSQSGIECFIGNHTYFRMTENKKSKEFFLNIFFTYDPITYNKFQNISYLKKPPSVAWVTGISSDGELCIDNLPIECPEIIHESFYPWLGEELTLDDYLDSYLNGNESILLLYGEKGQGKSTLLKYLLHKSGESAMITYQDNIRDLDIMFSNFISGSNKFLIIEDADEFLTKREAGNASMKRLLNIADGLTSNKDKKVIFTTNLSTLNSIDSALLRDGRCYDAIKFEVFTKEQTLEVIKTLDINPSLLTKEDYTLAELFAIKNNKLKRRVLKGRSASFGFSS